MKILVAGEGTRAFAVAKSVSRYGHEPYLIRGLSAKGFFRSLDCDPRDVTSVADAAEAAGISLAAVTDDNLINSCLTDALTSRGIHVFAPSSGAARVLSDRAAVIALADRAGVPVPRCIVVSSEKEAVAIIKRGADRERIVRPARGGDPIFAANGKEALAAVKKLFAAEKSVVIEQRLFGHSMGVSVITDGKTVFFPPVTSPYKDATRTYGAVAPNPFYTEKVREETEKRIIYPFLAAMKSKGLRPLGWLYFDIILTGYGPFLLDVKCFPPETEAETLLALIDSDFALTAADASCGALAAAKIGLNSGYALSLGIDDTDGKNSRAIEKRAYVYLNFGHVTKSDCGIEAEKGRIATVTVRAETFNSAYNGATDVATLSGIGGSFRSETGLDAYEEIRRKEAVNREKKERLDEIEKNVSLNRAANLVGFDYSDPVYREKLSQSMARITGDKPEKK